MKESKGIVMASIREVAKLAGVSPSTVSRVMNNTANVDSEKRRRVLAAIEETGFQPNELARALFKKSSKIIGVIVPNIENPFFSELAKSIEDEAYQQGYRILLCNSNSDVDKEKMNVQMLTQMNADGLILVTHTNEMGPVIDECKLPVVVVDRMLVGASGIAHLQSDHYKGGILATEHLLECGCKNIVCIRAPQYVTSGKMRYQAYKDVCAKYGIKEQYVDCKYSYTAGLAATEEILEKYPNVDGIIANNDMVAISAYKILQNRGYRVPEDVQIIGFDNIRFSRLVTPEISTIEQPIKEMGTLAVQIISNHINGVEHEKDYTLDVTLIERQTTRRIKV